MRRFRHLLLAFIMILAPSLMALPASAAPMSTHGGGCKLSMNQLMDVCISENAGHQIVADVYLFGPYQDCAIRIGIILDDGNEIKAEQVPCDGESGRVAGLVISASPGHSYKTDALFVTPVYDFGESYFQYT